MTEPHDTQLPALISPPPPPLPPPPADSRVAMGLAVAALLGVVALGWFVWQGDAQLATTRQELSRRLADSDAAQREAQANAKQNREALDALQAKVGALEAQLAGMQSQQMALETMYQEFSRVREDRLLAEIEQEISIAAQQLQIAGNVEAALIVLTGADARLARNAQPQFLPLRKLIARDIERLKVLPGADVPGIAFKLDGILNTVPGLPLAFEQRPAPSNPQGKAQPLRVVPPVDTAAQPAPTFAVMARAWFGDLWQEVRQLVRIERIDRPDPGLLAPRETFFLRENLRLRLLTARLALLARDGRSFQSDLKQSGEWLERYFDMRAPAVQEARAALVALGKLDVAREPVELNETLAALRNFKLVRERGERGATR